MSVNRGGWFEAFQTFSQFYPKLSAAIAFGTMAAVGRMIPTSRTSPIPNRTTNDSAEVKPLRQATATAPPASKRVGNARKTRKSFKRASSRRRKAA